MVDLLRSALDRYMGHGFQRHELAAGRGNWQGGNALRTLCELFFADDSQVDLVAPRVIIGGIRAIDERIDGVAEIGGGQLKVRSLIELGNDPYLGIRQIEAWAGKNLCFGD